MCPPRLHLYTWMYCKYMLLTWLLLRSFCGFLSCRKIWSLSCDSTIKFFLDLSAAFVTVDHSVLFDHLQYVVGIQGPFCGLPPTSRTDQHLLKVIMCPLPLHLSHVEYHKVPYQALFYFLFACFLWSLFEEDISFSIAMQTTPSCTSPSILLIRAVLTAAELH